MWHELLPMSGLRADALHEYTAEHLRAQKQPVTHLMFIGVPDGGVHRLGVYGKQASM